MSFIPALYGYIDPNNSTTTPLSAGQTFTGTATDVTNFSSIQVHLTSDQTSTTGGLSFQYSTNGTDWDMNISYSFVFGATGSSTSMEYSENVKSKYYRIVYTNGQFGQTTFRLQSILNAQDTPKTQLYGMSRGGNYPIPITASRQYSALNVNLAGPVSGFGDVRVVEPTQVSQFDFVYGLNTNYTFWATGGVGATITGANQMAVLTSTTASGNYAYLQSKSYFKYRDGLGGLMRFTTLFQTGTSNNNQIAGAGDQTDGYFFGYNDTNFGIIYRRNAVDSWIPQSQWNIDTMLGTGGTSNQSAMKLDPTKGNVYQISVTYLGFGDIVFYVYNQYSRVFTAVHVLQFVNQNTTTLVTNPALALSWQTINTGVTSTPVTIRTASGGIFVDGKNIRLGASYGRSIQKVNIGTTEIAMITIRNNTGINGYANKSSLEVTKIAFSAIDTTNANNSQVMQINLMVNPTLGGTPVYNNIDSINSIAAYDIAGTTITGGTLANTFTTCYTNSMVIDFDSYDIMIWPGDILTISAILTNSTANTRTSVSVNWIENT